MAKIIRKAQKIFGENGNTDQFAVFGTMKKVGEGQTPTYSKDIEVIQSNAAYSQGWQDAVIANYAPFMEELNSICYSLTYQMSYLLQNGVPEWDDETTYYINSIVVGSNSLLYRCLTDDCLNVDPTTDDGTNWYNYSLYGANQDLSNLTTAGIDKLHALKGYLDSGKLLSDPQLFESVYYYNHSNFDLSKFTAVGSPIITDEGILSNCTSSNYLQTANRINISADDDMCVYSPKFKLTSLGSEIQTVYSFYISENTSLQVRITSDNKILIIWKDNNGADIIRYTTSNSMLLNSEYQIKAERKSGIYKTYISVDNSDWTQTGVKNSASFNANFYLKFGVSLNNSTYPITTGELNLKSASIFINNTPVFSGNKTGINTIKPADYTVVGTPTISADGIATFTYDGYLSQNISLDITKKLIFYSSFIYKTANIGQTILEFKPDNIRLTTYQNKLNFSQSTTTGTTTFQDGQTYYYKAEYSNGIWKLYLLINGSYVLDMTTTGENSAATVFSNNITSINIGANTSLLQENNNRRWQGSIDLNALKIYVDGNLVYQPCLLIPYNLSSTGSKVVDVAYRDRVIDVYEQYGSALYYTIDETNKNVTLPMGEIYGFMPNITYW